MQVDAQEMVLMCDVIRDLCGLALDDRKAYLIENRLSKLAESNDCDSFGDWARKIRGGGPSELKNAVVDAITTDESLFFRDRSPFDALQHKALPEMIDAKAATPYRKRLRLWSAASSNRQEPYSIAMTIRELIPNVDTWDISILATDISNAAIARASLGEFTKYEISRGMTPQLLRKYFEPKNDRWKIKDEIRAMVAFQCRDLTQPFHGIGPFDIIFCRNVAIYFEKTVRDDLFRRIGELLNPNGYLFVGSSENLSTLGPQFSP